MRTLADFDALDPAAQATRAARAAARRALDDRRHQRLDPYGTYAFVSEVRGPGEPGGRDVRAGSAAVGLWADDPWVWRGDAFSALVELDGTTHDVELVVERLMLTGVPDALFYSSGYHGLAHLSGRGVGLLRPGVQLVGGDLGQALPSRARAAHPDRTVVELRRPGHRQDATPLLASAALAVRTLAGCLRLGDAGVLLVDATGERPVDVRCVGVSPTLASGLTAGLGLSMPGHAWFVGTGLDDAGPGDELVMGPRSRG